MQNGGDSLFSYPTKNKIKISRDIDKSEDAPGSRWSASRSWADDPGYSKPKSGLYRHSSSGQDDSSFTPDFEKDDGFLMPGRADKPYYARNEQRTLLIKGISERTTHKDIVSFIRGGTLLDVYLRSNERSASVSFVEGSAAQEFMAYAKKNDIYVHGKRVGHSPTWPSY